MYRGYYTVNKYLCNTCSKLISNYNRIGLLKKNNTDL